MHFCGKCGTSLSGDNGFNPEGYSSTPISELGVLVGSDLKQRFRKAGLESAGQRRTVTVLFADLCDYTGLSGQLDEESDHPKLYSYVSRESLPV